MAGAPEFTEQDTRRFKPEARRIIAFARVLEWKVRWSNQKRDLAILHAPVGGKELHIPLTNINHNRARSWVRQMMTYSDPVKVLNLMEGGYDMRSEPDIASLVATYGVELSEQVKKWREEDDMRTTTAVAAAMDEAVAVAEKRKTRLAVAKAAPDTVSERTVVSKTPWLAKRGGQDGGKGRMYESQTVSHLVYDDGTGTYSCNFCEYLNQKPRAVAIHAGKHHEQALGLSPVEQRRSPENDGRRRRKPQPPTIVVENYEASGFHRGSGVRRLSNDIVKAMDSLPLDWQSLPYDQIAEQLAQAIVENRPERAEAEPLSDEEVLRRITSLVDRGRLADMHRQVESLTEQLRVTSEARAEAESRADRYAGNLTALKDMLNAEEES